MLLASFFETGWDGWADGGSDARRSINDAAYAYEGSYAIRLRDNTSTSTMTSPSLDVSSYASVDVEFFFYARSMEPGEDFWLQYNDGSGWVTVATYARGSDFENNAFYTSTVNLDSGVFNLVNNGQFRFRCDASGNNDLVYIDAITISGNDSAARANNDSRPLYIGPGQVEALETYTLNSEDDATFTLYPNPAVDILNVQTQGKEVSEAYIFSALGMQVMHLQDLGDTVNINISDLPTGTYFVRFVADEQIVTRQFIKE